MSNTGTIRLPPALEDFRATIETLNPNDRKEMLKWLEIQKRYFNQKFEKNRYVALKRGDVVFVHFGFNVGDEFRGLHFAVVIENNDVSSSIVTVVPLSSLTHMETEENVHPNEVYVGKIDGLPNEKQSVALVSQIRAISKFRIYRPKKGDSIISLSSVQLDKLDEKIILRYTKRTNNPTSI